MTRIAVILGFALIAAACTGTSPATVTDPNTAASPTTGSGDGEVVATTTGGTGITCWSANPSDGSSSITFDDVTAAVGLIDPLTGMRAHAAAWGDVDGDLEPDLLVGTFATARNDVYTVRGADGPSPDRLLLSEGGRYESATNFPEEFGRTSGAVFVDLDNDGDDDLVLSRNVRDRDVGAAATTVMENTGNGFVAAADSFDPNLGGRSVGVLDVDGDGLLDLLIVEDRYMGGSSRLYRNLGGLRFEDATGLFRLRLPDQTRL